MDWNTLLLPTATAFGIALLHSLWIGALIYALVRTALPLLRTPAARHHLAYGGLLALALSFVVAFYRNFDAAPVCENLLATTINLSDFATAITATTPTQSWRETLLAVLPGLAPWLSMIYAVGLLPALFFLLRDQRRSLQLRNRGTYSFPDTWLTGLAAELAAHPATRRVRCHLSDRANEVMTLGFWSPVIVFPVALVNDLSPEMARTILLHEIAHLRAWDHWLNYPQQLLKTFFFYHPAAHALCHLIDREREHRCDDWVAARCPDRRTYATALVTVARTSLYPKNTLAMSASKTPFSARIQRLFHGEAPRRGHFAFAFLFLGLLGIGHLSFTTLGADAGAVDCLEEQGKDTAQPTPPAVEPVVPPTEHVYEITPDELADMVTDVPDPYYGLLVNTVPAGSSKSIRSKSCTSVAVDALPSAAAPVLQATLELPEMTLVKDTIVPPAKEEESLRLKGASTAPLYIIDGVAMEFGSTNEIDPDDIKEITIVKGQSALDSYGEAGVNGVILITMKKGTQPNYKFVPKENLPADQKLGPENFTEQQERFTRMHNGKVGYLLDGKKVKYAKIQALQPEDIQSVRVYKGVEQAAEFGFPKMEGVIVIVTK